MRYYRIDIADAGSSNYKTWFTSHPNEKLQPPDPGAVKVEIDVYTAGGASAVLSTGSGITIWGIPISLIGQAQVFNGKSLRLYGGMGKGLPLANPNQAGLLIQGLIIQSFANWVGTVMTLNFVVTTGGTDPALGPGKPVTNLTVQWKASTTLGSALKTAFETAYKSQGYTVTDTSSSKIVQNSDEPGFSGNWTQVATWANGRSRDILGANTNLSQSAPYFSIDPTKTQYTGIDIKWEGNTIVIYDGSDSSTPTKISYTDLIGQPTWIKFATIQVTTVMRSDIKTGSKITLPKTRAQASPGLIAPSTNPAGSPAFSNVVFGGTWLVGIVHHIGNYKDPSALSWITTFNCTLSASSGDGTSSVQTTTTPSLPSSPSPGLVPL